MSAETWQPGDALPGVEFGADYHALVEETEDHSCSRWSDRCEFSEPWDPQLWRALSHLGPHDDTLPPLPWLHGRAS